MRDARTQLAASRPGSSANPFSIGKEQRCARCSVGKTLIYSITVQNAHGTRVHASSI